MHLNHRPPHWSTNWLQVEAHPYWRNSELVSWCQASQEAGGAWRWPRSEGRLPASLPAFCYALYRTCTASMQQCTSSLDDTLPYGCIPAPPLCAHLSQERGIHVTAYSPLGSPHTAGFFKRGGTPQLSPPGGGACCQMLPMPRLLCAYGCFPCHAFCAQMGAGMCCTCCAVLCSAAAPAGQLHQKGMLAAMHQQADCARPSVQSVCSLFTDSRSQRSGS